MRYFVLLGISLLASVSASVAFGAETKIIQRLTDPRLEEVGREFERATDRVSIGDWDYASAIYRRLKVIGGVVLSLDELQAIANLQLQPTVRLLPVPKNETGFDQAARHACHSGYVNDYCGGLPSRITTAVTPAGSIEIFVGALRDSHMSHGYAIFYDRSAQEILILGSGYLHTM